jgi:hypothetical protein
MLPQSRLFHVEPIAVIVPALAPAVLSSPVDCPGATNT